MNELTIVWGLMVSLLQLNATTAKIPKADGPTYAINIISRDSLTEMVWGDSIQLQRRTLDTTAVWSYEDTIGYKPADGYGIWWHYLEDPTPIDSRVQKRLERLEFLVDSLVGAKK